MRTTTCRPEELDNWVRLPGVVQEGGLFAVAPGEPVGFDATETWFLKTGALAELIRTARQCQVWIRVRPGAVRDLLLRVFGPHVFKQDPQLLDFWEVFPHAAR